MMKSIYVIGFGFLGLLISTIIHGVVELIALNIIFSNPDMFSETIWWQKWKLIHDVVSYGLWLVGVTLGLYTGFKWWEPYGKKSGFFHWRRILM